jgi:predicted aspartyl protease
MGAFYTAFRVEQFPQMTRGINVPRALVDTGAEFTGVPASRLTSMGMQPVKSESFTTADGKTITRDVGFAVVRMSRRFTVDEVIFAQPGDLTLLGSRTLEGLGLMVDARRKRLVAAGPAPAATAIRPAIVKAMGIIVPGSKQKGAKGPEQGKRARAEATKSGMKKRNKDASHSAT